MNSNYNSCSDSSVLAKLLFIFSSRRNWCEPGDDPNNNVWEQRTLLEVVGLANANDYCKSMWKQQLLDEFKNNFKYKVTCSCDRCVIFEVVVYKSVNEMRSTAEPMMEAVLNVLDLFHLWNFRRVSSSGVNNADGSTTTTWLAYNSHERS